jgi:hypothetical protein
MFDGFQEQTIGLTNATLHVRFGGKGLPLLPTPPACCAHTAAASPRSPRRR